MPRKLGSNPLDAFIRDTRDEYSRRAYDVQDAPSTQDVPDAQHALDVQATQGAPDIHNKPVARLAHDAHDVQETLNALEPLAPEDRRSTAPTPPTQGRKGQKLPRINMAFSPERLRYLQAIAGFERVSLTHYVNSLIEKDMRERDELYSKLNSLRGGE